MGLERLPCNIGLKLHTTNTDLIPDAIKIGGDYFDFIELYVVPGTYKETIESWKKFNAVYIIHAPHSFHGVNLAQAGMKKVNLQHLRETQLFADDLQSDIIILHGGNNGSIDETIDQIECLQDNRIAFENKPKIGASNELCIGWSPAEFQKIADAGHLSGFVLDFAHAACAARAEGIDEVQMIESFLAFHPILFHLSDGDSLSEKDNHLNLGKGNRDLGFYVGCVPPGGSITLETPRNPATGLDEFIEDVVFLSKLFRKRELSLSAG